MRNIKKAIAAAIVIAGFATNANAQSTDYASTTATLVAPISVKKIVDMNFGQLAASGSLGVVALDYSDGVTKTGGVKLLSGIPVKTAEFLVEGYDNQGFSITHPATITLTGSTSGTLIVRDIACDALTASNLVSGSKTIKLKANLEVPANAVAGTYVNNSADQNSLYVTVNYN